VPGKLRDPLLGRAWNGVGIAAVVALVVPAAAAAGVATSDGGTARFADPAGAKDVLAADLELVDEMPNVDPPGWSVSFLQFDPPATWGGGCQEGFVGTLCAFGASPPAAIEIDLGAGDDQLDFGIKAATAPPTRITLAGGAGADRIATVRTRAEIDGGEGDDVLLPDERWALDFPPDPSPGGVVRGGAGTDTVSYELALDPIDVSLDGAANDGRRGEGDNVHDDVEHIVASEFGGTLSGSAAGNRILGADGPDRIEGGAGRDTLSGMGGNDTLDALDAAGGDRVDCGEGDDAALADAGDGVAAGCETLAWAPRLATSKLRYRSGRVAVRLSCPKAASRCRGTVRLRSAGSNPKTLAAASYRLKRGKRTTLRLAPTRAGRPAFKRRSVKAIAILQPAGATTDTGRAVSVRR
jgi:Ca2+-binding RTX toxin-like protein